jgi:hypothetical protein
MASLLLALYLFKLVHKLVELFETFPNSLKVSGVVGNMSKLWVGSVGLFLVQKAVQKMYASSAKIEEMLYVFRFVKGGVEGSDFHMMSMGRIRVEVKPL